jgi:hypothetical protein
MVRELWKFAYQPLANALKRKSVERLYDVIKGPFPEEIILSLLKGQGTGDYNARMRRLGLYGVECRDCVDSIHLRHHQIECNHVWPALSEQL